MKHLLIAVFLAALTSASPVSAATVSRNTSPVDAERILAESGCNASVRTLGRLATSRHKDVRLMVARYPCNLPLRVSSILVEDRSGWVREELAKRSDLSPHLYGILVSPDEEKRVRAALARNPNIPGHIVAILAADPSRYVRRLASEHPKAGKPTRAVRRVSDVANDKKVRALEWLIRNEGD